MILLNGVREKARFTSRQAKGNAVIDFVWVQAEDLKLIKQLETVEDEKVRLSDHLMVVVSFLNKDIETSSPIAAIEEDGAGYPKRWKVKGVQDHFTKLREVGNLLMGNWSCESKGGIQQTADEVWANWLSMLTQTVELGIGYAQPSRARHPGLGRDAQLARLIEERNVVRSRRDKAKDSGTRADLQKNQSVLQSCVKQRLGEVRSRDIGGW